MNVISKLPLLLTAMFFVIGLGGIQEATAVAGKGDVIDYSKYGRKGERARKARLDIPEKHYDPNTIVYVDALWMRVHEADCPMLVLKEHKKTMTLEEADRAGYRIGESGQSGRHHCCFHGYRRKYPEKEITDDAIGIVEKRKNGKYKFHMAGCHRFKVSPNDKVMTLKEAKSKALPGFYMCMHCIERGPSLTYVDAEKLAEPKPAQGRSGLWPPYVNPLAAVEEFMGRRFFFGYSGNYKRYRSTGDKSALDELRQTARYYHNICVKYPSASQLKARIPEHANYLFEMVGWSRIIMQLARKSPSSITWEEFMEAEAMLKAVIVALEPHWEGNENLDPEMGIPSKLAADFRGRAYNRNANGIGMVATAAKALEDLQALNQSQEYQPTIDRYRKCVREWINNWKKKGCLYTEADGKTYFYYKYMGTGKKRADGLMLAGADDRGHYSYSASGATLMYEAAPELGADDEFMTAIANAIYHNSTTEYGSIQCPSADRIAPSNRKPGGPAGPKGGFLTYEAWRDGLLKSLYRHQSAAAKEAAAERVRSGNNYWDYFKALRKDRSLIHLGEKITKGRTF